jgi:hypothetical protein
LEKQGRLLIFAAFGSTESTDFFKKNGVLPITIG